MFNDQDAETDGVQNESTTRKVARTLRWDNVGSVVTPPTPTPTRRR